MPSPPSFRKVNPADAPILFLTLSSPTLPLSEVDHYAETVLGQRLSMAAGVAQVNVFGAQKFAVRVDVDPTELASRQIGVNDVAAAIPGAVKLSIRSDRSESIRESVNDIKFTLLLTVFLVVLVIFLFLRNLSATVIPSLALPFSVVGTFAIMWAFGYSLDNLSLMALTL